MQIVAGRFRHRRLETNPGDTTRPLLTRVKVSLFDRLERELTGCRVADICSGTGTIGLEALSRGAKGVVFFEQDSQAFELLRRNIRTLGVQSETVTWRTDVTKCSFRPKDADDFLPFDLIFFDPPYRHLENMRPGTMLYRSLIRLAKPAISAPGAKLLVRCATQTVLQLPPVWTLGERLDYSSMTIHIFVKTPGLAEVSGDDESAEAGDTPASGELEATGDLAPSNEGPAPRAAADMRAAEHTGEREEPDARGEVAP